MLQLWQPVRKQRVQATSLGEMLRERRCERLRQTEDVLAIEIGDDERDESSSRQRGHCWGGVLRLELGR